MQVTINKTVSWDDPPHNLVAGMLAAGYIPLVLATWDDDEYNVDLRFLPPQDVSDAAQNQAKELAEAHFDFLSAHIGNAENSNEFAVAANSYTETLRQDHESASPDVETQWAYQGHIDTNGMVPDA